MEELIKKHLGINTPKWIIKNCKALLIEWDSQKVDTSEMQLTIPDFSDTVCDVCGKQLDPRNNSGKCDEHWEKPF